MKIFCQLVMVPVGYIASVLAEREKRDSLRTLLRDLIKQHGEPAPGDIKWAERMLPRRGRGSRLTPAL
jgi:hypothetical protein